MTLIPHAHDPFAPILDEIAKHGENVAPIPVNHAIERQADGSLTHSVDVDVRIPNRISFDLCAFGATFSEALSKAVAQVRREFGRC